MGVCGCVGVGVWVWVWVCGFVCVCGVVLPGSGVVWCGVVFVCVRVRGGGDGEIEVVG